MGSLYKNLSPCPRPHNLSTLFPSLRGRYGWIQDVPDSLLITFQPKAMGSDRPRSELDLSRQEEHMHKKSTSVNQEVLGTERTWVPAPMKPGLGLWKGASEVTKSIEDSRRNQGYPGSL